MTTPQRIASQVGVIVVLAGMLAVLTFAPRRSPKIAFYPAGVSPSSNASLISIAISNQSASSIVYFVGNPVLKSNGVWGAFQFPTGTELLSLGAGQSVTNLVLAASATGEVKVPVLWGFTYTADATLRQEIWEDVVAYFHMNDRRGRGALYTNFVTGIKL